MIVLPNFRTHFVAGLLIGLFFVYLALQRQSVPIEWLVAGVFTSIFYGLLPDFDKGDSKINEAIELFLVVAAVVLFFFNQIVFSIVCAGIFVFGKFLKHRGWFHSVLVGIILSCVLFFVSPFLVFFAIAGWMIHLLLDYFPFFG